MIIIQHDPSNESSRRKANKNGAEAPFIKLFACIAILALLILIVLFMGALILAVLVLVLVFLVRHF
jgi:fatty acid desaturase